jgi:UDP-glucose 4-epimerase
MADAGSNVLGTLNVLEAARAHEAQVILASTGGAIYGECDGPAGEDAPRLPLSPYGTSKLAGEEYLATWNRLYGARHVALRLGNVYGPRQDPHGEAGVVAIFLSRIRDGQEATIYGDGSQTRDYVFSRDVARAFVGAVGAEGGVFNVGTGEETSVVALWDACLAAAGKEGSAATGPARLGELQRSCLDPHRAETTLHWRAEVPLSAGLRETWEWIREE